MSKKRYLVLSIIFVSAMLLAACTSAATLTTASAVPTGVPVQANLSSINVGLVTDIGGVNDKAFNQLAWIGVQKATKEMGFQSKFIDSRQPGDYEKNIEALAAEGYNVIIAVGSKMGDATALKAKQHPNIKFAIVDNTYVPTSGSPSCANTIKDCYTDGGLTNVTSLMFAEEQLGFLAGVLAGGMSKSGFVCSISSMKTPASDRYVISYRGGAVWQAGENIKGMNNYINIQNTDSNVPTIADSTEGKETAHRLIGAGCDVVFGVAANGALLAAKENNVMAIGFEVDQYNTYPEAKSALLSSVQKNVDVAVYNYLKTVANDSVKAGISIATLQNGGIGLAPFHDWESNIPADLKARIQKASDRIKDGSIRLDIPSAR